MTYLKIGTRTYYRDDFCIGGQWETFTQRIDAPEPRPMEIERIPYDPDDPDICFCLKPDCAECQREWYGREIENAKKN